MGAGSEAQENRSGSKPETESRKSEPAGLESFAKESVLDRAGGSRF